MGLRAREEQFNKIAARVVAQAEHRNTQRREDTFRSELERAFAPDLRRLRAHQRTAAEAAERQAQLSDAPLVMVADLQRAVAQAREEAPGDRGLTRVASRLHGAFVTSPYGTLTVDQAAQIVQDAQTDFPRSDAARVLKDACLSYALPSIVPFDSMRRLAATVEDEDDYNRVVVEHKIDSPDDPDHLRARMLLRRLAQLDPQPLDDRALATLGLVASPNTGAAVSVALTPNQPVVSGTLKDFAVLPDPTDTSQRVRVVLEAIDAQGHAEQIHEVEAPDLEHGIKQVALDSGGGLSRTARVEIDRTKRSASITDTDNGIKLVARVEAQGSLAPVEKRATARLVERLARKAGGFAASAFTPVGAVVSMSGLTPEGAAHVARAAQEVVHPSTARVDVAVTGGSLADHAAIARAAEIGKLYAESRRAGRQASKAPSQLLDTPEGRRLATEIDTVFARNPREAAAVLRTASRAFTRALAAPAAAPAPAGAALAPALPSSVSAAGFRVVAQIDGVDDAPETQEPAPEAETLEGADAEGGGPGAPGEPSEAPKGDGFDLAPGMPEVPEETQTQLDRAFGAYRDRGFGPAKAVAEFFREYKRVVEKWPDEGTAERDAIEAQMVAIAAREWSRPAEVDQGTPMPRAAAREAVEEAIKGLRRSVARSAALRRLDATKWPWSSAPDEIRRVVATALREAQGDGLQPTTENRLRGMLGQIRSFNERMAADIQGAL
jgi:hypothetical protein